MDLMKFIDEARIEVVAGHGGSGSASMRREKFIEFGGPDGGDGGRGGSVYVIADRNINTLVDYRFAKKHLAQNGESGRGADCYGRAGEDIELRMPVGTIIHEMDTNEVIADLAYHGQRLCLAKGGAGVFHGRARLGQNRSHLRAGFEQFRCFGAYDLQVIRLRQVGVVHIH